MSENLLYQSLYYIPLGEMLLYVKEMRTLECIIFTLYVRYNIKYFKHIFKTLYQSHLLTLK